VRTPRAEIEHAFKAALTAVDPYLAVRHYLESANHEGHPTWLIAIGKAASPMLAGAIDALGTSVQSGFLITKDGHIDRDFDARFILREAAHPVLDQRTLTATGELLEWATGIPRDDNVIVLLSGGGSAILERPVPSVPLDDFQTTTRTLLMAGADIYQLNTVRSQISLVKGGRLRSAIPASVVETLALSDVLGNDPTIIASGPTVPGTRSRKDALHVLDELRVRDRIPASVLAVLDSGTDQPSPASPLDVYSIIADNASAVSAALADFEAVGRCVMARPQFVAGEASDAGREWVKSLKSVPDTLEVVLSGGELTVTVRGEGIGGRNTEFALAAAIELEGSAEWTVASLATDGQDAATGAAGAIVDGQTMHEIRQRNLDASRALEVSDSYPVLDAVGATVHTGPTGTNVNDLYFAVRNRQA
jgi:hydroxypyruvate reductase